MHQAVVSQTLDTTRFYDSSPNAEVCASLCSAEECMGLTPGEISIAGGIMRLNVLNLEEAHWQRDNGSLSEDAVQSTIASPQRRFAMPGIRTAFGIWHLAFGVERFPGPRSLWSSASGSLKAIWFSQTLTKYRLRK